MPHNPDADEPDDRVRCQHMLEAAQQAVHFLEGRERNELDTDHMLRRAVKDCIQEIGEAAARMTDSGRSRSSGLPWGKIVAMRHILVHAYFEVDVDTIWKVATDHLPQMIIELRSALANWPDE